MGVSKESISKILKGYLLLAYPHQKFADRFLTPIVEITYLVIASV